MEHHNTIKQENQKLLNEASYSQLFMMITGNHQWSIKNII